MTTPKTPIQPVQSKKQSCVSRAVRLPDLLKFQRWFKTLIKEVPKAERWVGYDEKQYLSTRQLVIDILYRIAFLLDEVRDDLLKYPKVARSLIAKDLEKEFISKWDSIDKKKFLKDVRYAKIVLKNVRIVIERNKRYGVVIPKPADQEQNIKQLGNGGRNETTNLGKVIQFFFRLYEITIKVVVDAVLERIWPKPN